MRTPRPGTGGARGIATLIGNGWLHAAPRAPRAWDLRGRSAMRNCMFMPVPDAVKALAPRQPAALLLPPVPRRPEPEIGPVRRDPRRYVREMPVYAPRADVAPRVARAASLWEDPVALGALLFVIPPIGLAVLWTSPRYASDARWALTIMTGLLLFLGAAIAMTALVLHP